MVEKVTWIKSGKMINVDEKVKIQNDITYVRKIIFGVLLHVAL